MACRRRHAQEVAAYYDNSAASAHTETVEELYWRRPEPSAPPARGGRGAAEYWQGAAVASLAEAGQAATHAFRMADQGGNVQIMFVNNLQVHVNNQHDVVSRAGSQLGAGQVLISHEEAQADVVAVVQSAQLHFHANDPDFHPCTCSPKGLDFGNKVVSRRYKAQKHVHAEYNMITYTQCPSTAQTISHALTLHLSHKSSKHAIFLFDSGGLVDELASKWPSIIHFTEIKSLIQQLGPGYEYHRHKVKSKRFSGYFYVVKRIGVRFSEQGRKAWSSLFQWAHSLHADSSGSNAGSNLSSSQVIAQVAGIGLALVSVL